jgi:hypothetical protein
MRAFSFVFLGNGWVALYRVGLVSLGFDMRSDYDTALFSFLLLYISLPLVSLKVFVDCSLGRIEDSCMQLERVRPVFKVANGINLFMAELNFIPGFIAFKCLHTCWTCWHNWWCSGG